MSVSFPGIFSWYLYPVSFPGIFIREDRLLTLCISISPLGHISGLDITGCLYSGIPLLVYRIVSSNTVKLSHHNPVYSLIRFSLCRYHLFRYTPWVYRYTPWVYRIAQPRRPSNRSPLSLVRNDHVWITCVNRFLAILLSQAWHTLDLPGVIPPTLFM